MKKVRQIKAFRVFVWNTFNGIITLLTTLLLMQTDDRWIGIAPIIMSGLSFLTKFINNKYFNDLGVNNEG